MAKLANNVAQFGHHVGQQLQVKKCLRHLCTCSEHFRKYLLFDGMLSNLATMFANNSTHSDKSYRIKNMQKSLGLIVPSRSLVAKWILNQMRKGWASQGQKNLQGLILDK